MKRIAHPLVLGLAGCSIIAFTACGDGGGGTSSTPACDPTIELCDCQVTADCPQGYVCNGILCQSAGDTVDGELTTDPDAVESDIGDDTIESDADADSPDVEEDADTTVDTDGDTVETDADVISDVIEDTSDADAPTPDIEFDIPFEELPDLDVETDSGEIITIDPIDDPYIVFVSQVLFDATQPPAELRRDQLMLTRRGLPNALHIDTGDVDTLWPTFSPDGTRIAFIAGTRAARTIRVVNIETGEVETIADALPPSPQGLSWSLDGNSIFFDALRPDATGQPTDTREIYAYRFDTDAIDRLTTTDENELFPLVTPSGRVFFTILDSGDGGFGSMNPDGTNYDAFSGPIGLSNSRAAVDPDGQFLLSPRLVGESPSFIRYVLIDEDITTLASGPQFSFPTIAADGGSMVMFTTTLGDGQSLVPANPFTAMINGSPYAMIPDAAAHPGITFNTGGQVSAPAIAPISGSAIDLAESITGSGTK